MKGSVREKKKWVGRCLALLIALSLLMTAMSAVAAAAATEDLRRAPFVFHMDRLGEQGGFSSSSALMIVSDVTLPLDTPLTLEGWLATDEGVSAYEYAWISEDTAAPEWQRPLVQEIFRRPDLAAEIPYEGGHGTAGYRLEIWPDTSMKDGYYDLYLRAITGDGVVCDVLAVTDLIYGEPDIDDGESRRISFSRLARTEGALHEAEVKKARLLLTNESVVALGEINLAAFEKISVTYSVDKACNEERAAAIGFKSSPDRTYGDGTGPYDLTDHIVALPLDTAAPGRTHTATVDIEGLTVHGGSLYLSAYLEDGITLFVHDITFVYKGMGYDRTAAKIHFSEDLLEDFGGSNLVTLSGVSDPVMGDVLRIEASEATNDPYTYFQASSVLARHDLRLNADDYKYMVVLARAGKENLHSPMTFYLCAGTIYSATEACTYTHNLITDGEWHYYVFDLSERENWTGNINGWRFDIISGDSNAGNYVDFATIQLFRTPEAAATAASASVTDYDTPYAVGMPAVEEDPCEDASVDESPMIFPDGSWYVAEDTAEDTSAVEPPTEAETTPSEETVTAGEALIGSDGGCSAGLSGAVAILLTVLSGVAWLPGKLKRKQS